MSREQLQTFISSRLPHLYSTREATVGPQLHPRAAPILVDGLLHCFTSIPESPAEPACLLSMGIWGPLLGRGCRGVDRTARRNPHPYILSPYVRACTVLYCLVLTEH